MDIYLKYLGEMPDAAALIAQWFKNEWPDFFSGVSLPQLTQQFLQRTNTSEIPLALLAINPQNQVTGTVSITPSSITTRPNLGPWLSGLYVHPNFRHNGIATQLIQAVENLAPQLGCSCLYAGTGRIQQLFRQLNWQELEVTPYHGEELSVFRKNFTV